MSASVIVIVIVLVFLVLRVGNKQESLDTELRRATLTEDDIRRALLSGSKIEAIKIHRTIHHTGLKEAKDAVEAIEREMRKSGQLH